MGPGCSSRALGWALPAFPCDKGRHKVCRRGRGWGSGSAKEEDERCWLRPSVQHIET